MTLSYEQCKNLKEKGFEQKGSIGTKFYHFISHPRMGIPPQNAITTQITDTTAFDWNEDYFKIPTLEELIEACGDKFQLLERVCVHKIQQQEWQAIAVKEITPKKREDEEIIGKGYGDTPIEAVYNLFISLKS